jgi:TRAP transporter 4TM/12TM fusion protein
MSEQDAGKTVAQAEEAKTDVIVVDAQQMKEVVDDYKRQPTGKIKVAVGIIGASLTLFSLYTAQFGLLVANKQRAVFLALALVMTFLLYPGRFSRKKEAGIVDILFSILGFVSVFYIVVVFDQLALRQGWPTPLDFAMGSLAIVMLSMAAIRVAGFILPSISLLFLAYCYFGQWIPGKFGHRGFSIISIVRHMYLSTEGIFGLPLGVVSDFIYLFIFFGVILTLTGVGKVFIDLSLAILGRQRGGPAKVAVVASGFFGMINGSSVANVVGIGTFTIPLMKSIGYRPEFAGAVEAAASTGGQIMPPIMGAAAFIMAEFLGVSYLTVAVAAALPAVLYYTGVLASVHIEAVRTGLQGLPKEKLPSLKAILMKDGYMLIPIPIIIVALVMGYTPTMAALWAIYVSLALPFIPIIGKKENQYDWKGLYTMLVKGATGALELLVICGLIGFIIGAASLTGIGLKLASFIVELSFGHLLPALILTMIASLILGTGIPTTGTYIVMALMAAPALKLMGVAPMGAHMFVFYFGIISDITPPVALAAMVAAGLAGASFWPTGLNATKLAVAGFVIPFMFVYNPALLLDLDNIHIAETTFNVVTAIIGVIALAGVVQNYFYVKLKVHERIMLIIAAFLLIMPTLIHSLIGAILLGVVVVLQIYRSKKQSPAIS